MSVFKKLFLLILKAATWKIKNSTIIGDSAIAISFIYAGNAFRYSSPISVVVSGMNGRFTSATPCPL